MILRYCAFTLPMASVEWITGHTPAGTRRMESARSQTVRRAWRAVADRAHQGDTYAAPSAPHAWCFRAKLRANTLTGSQLMAEQPENPERSTRRAQRPFARRARQLIVGRLKEHGPARYQFRPDQDLSYFARIVTTSGMKVLWGKDLERAIRAGETKPKVWVI